MSEDLYRGYGKKFVFRKNDLFGIDRNWKSLEESDPDYLVFYDSDDGFFYEAVKIEKISLGNVLSDYQSRKITYNYLFDSEGIHEQDLMNGYNLPGKFDDKKKIYEVGYLLPFSTVFVIDDSDGPRLWRKRADPGDKKSDYDRYIPNKEPLSNLTSASGSFVMDHQINQSTFDMFAKTGTRVTLYGDELIYHHKNINIAHGEFSGIKSPLLQVIEDDSELKQVFTFENATKVDKDGYYTEFRTFDSDYILMDLEDTAANEKIERFKIRYVTQAGDSEVQVTPDFYIKPTYVTYPKTPLHEDSDIVEAIIPGTAPAYHPDHEPWRVFSDSDNNGFKAQLGVDNGIIGINKQDDFVGRKIMNLKKASFKNTPAVLAPNRPYNFRIQTYNPDRTPDWQIVHTELGFTGYNFTKEFGPDSEQPCTRVRFVFDACQPNFDPAVNALEVSSIKFEFEERIINIDKKYRSFFTTNANVTQQFSIIDSEIIDAFLLSAGGGGGGGWAGAGGCGGTTVIARDIKLKPGRYQIRVGSGGLAQGPGPDNGGTHNFLNTTNANRGGTTYLYDVDRAKNIISVQGGGGGNGTACFGPQEYANIAWSTTGGTPGDADIDSEVVGSWIVYPGLPGGLGAQGNEVPALDGGEGHRLGVRRYLSSVEFDSENNVFGSGGGGGGADLLTLTDGNQAVNGVPGTNAGAPAVANQGFGRANYGGGGGGLFRVTNDVYQGGNGGSGYAYITFK